MNNNKIIKNALPWTGSNAVGDMVDQSGSYTDMIGPSEGPTDSLVPEKTVLEDASPTYGYDGGILSPTYGEDWELYWDDEDSFMEPERSSNNLVAMLDRGDSVLDVGSGNGKHASFMSKRGLDVIGIDISESAIDMSNQGGHDFVSIQGDIRYYSFDKKFDGFQALSVLEHIENPIIAIRNIYNQLKPTAYGVIHTDDTVINPGDVRGMVQDVGFDILKENSFRVENRPYSEYLLRKRDSDKIAFLCINLDQKEGVCPVSRKYLSEDDRSISAVYNDKKYFLNSLSSLRKFELSPERYTGSKVYLSCDVANSRGDKIAGLQVYPRIKSGVGLLFPYKVAQDVVYHMGSVRYPIDILFVDEKNIIKKIYKNIEPGSPATFGAASIKNVLEIKGGMSERLGIVPGNSVDIRFEKNTFDELGTIKNVISSDLGSPGIIKSSGLSSGGTYRFDDLNIIEINNQGQFENGLSKIASLITKKEKDVHAFCIDEILKNTNIKLFSTEDSGPAYRVSSKDLINSDLSFIRNNNLKFKRGPKGSYSDVISEEIKDDFKRVFREVVKVSKNSSNKVVFLTKFLKNSDYAAEILLSRLEDTLGLHNSKINADVLTISSYNNDEIFKAIHSFYGDPNPSVYAPNINFYKESSGSISDDVTKKAKEALDHFSRSSEKIEILLKNLNKNLEEYNKFDGNDAVIRSSMGQYNESVKRNKKIIEDGLTSMLSGIKIMNEIKDISTTMELVDSMASSAKVATDYIQEVFDLVKSIDSEEFLMLLREKTGNCENSTKDCLETIKRTKSYINKDILGIVIISD